VKRILSVLPLVGGIATVLSFSIRPSFALEATEISAIAEEFTVKIGGEDTGTGTIIENYDGSYSVLTCWHVVDTPGNYQATTVDGRIHQITKIENLPDVDLAVVTFLSSNEYPVAEFGESDKALPGLDAYVAAYPDPIPGIPERGYLSKISQIERRRDDAEDGYEIMHSSLLPEGSSGGGLFDSDARLIGINSASVTSNTGAGNGIAIPTEIYLAAQDDLVTVTEGAESNFVSIGKQRLEEKDYQGAIAEFDSALDAYPEDLDALYGRSEAYFALKEYGAALKDLDEAIDLNPNSSYAYASKGAIYSDKGEYDLALANFEEAIYLRPDYAGAYLSRGNSYFAQKAYRQAIADYNEALRLEPHNPFAYASRGNYYYAFRDYKSAIADYNKTIRLNPNSARAYFSRGRSYGKLQKYERAIADYDEAIYLRPEYAEAYRHRGNSYSKQGYNEQAIADYDEAISLNPEYAEAYYGRGFSYSKLGDYEQALTDFDEAIYLNPEYTLAYYNRGLSYLRLQEYDRANADFDKTIRLDPNYADAYFNCGLSHKIVGDDKDALKDFEQAAKLYREQGNMKWYRQALAQIKELQSQNAISP